MVHLKRTFVYGKELMLVGCLVFMVFLVEVLIFQREVISNIFWDQSLKEQRYSVSEGTLHQFKLDKEKLISQSTDPNITFENINAQIGRISISCKNSIPGAIGQVFYRDANEPFSESRSIVYNTSLNSNNKILDLPTAQAVTSLRFDLTNLQNDKVICEEFVINPHAPMKFNRNGLIWRLILYACFLLSAIIMDSGFDSIENLRAH